MLPGSSHPRRWPRTSASTSSTAPPPRPPTTPSPPDRHVDGPKTQDIVEFSAHQHLGGYFRVQPPSAARLTPLTLPFSSRKRAASESSRMLTSRPIGVRAAIGSSAPSGLSAQ